MNNPYGAPTKEIAPAPLPVVRWQRILVWGFLVYAAAMLVGFSSGLTMAYWEVYGKTMEEAIANARLIRRLIYGAVGAVLYWRFAAAIAARRVLHVLALYVWVRIIDLGVSLSLFGDSVQSWFDPWALGRSLLAALVGLIAANLLGGRSFMRKQPADAARSGRGSNPTP